MFRNRLLKILALLMVLNILIIPLTTFTPQQQNKYKVYAAEGIVDIRFYNALVSLIGITAAGIAAMSPSFSIPEVDMIQLKDQFAQSLESDAAKKTAWMNAQADYLAGGVAKTMGAVELAKIGVNDIINQFTEYINNKPVLVDNSGTETTSLIIDNMTITKTIDSVNGYNGYINFMTRALSNPWSYEYFASQNVYVQKDVYSVISPDNGLHYSIAGRYGSSLYFGLTVEWQNYVNVIAKLDVYGTLTDKQLQYLISQCSSIGIDIRDKYPDILTTGIVNGSVSSNTLINSTDTTKSVLPTIPWLDPSVSVGTIVTPAISAPYAGTVPIDVPITVPIDPPIDVPVDPPVEPTLIGTVAAILAGLTPIAGFLEYILAGQVTLTDTIEAGITGVIDGIGDIAGTLTGGITSSLTDIQSSISTLFDPPTETLNLDKLKNLNSVLFTKFPFSIPFDFVSMISAFSSDPVAPVITIPFDMSDFGGQFTEVKMDLSDYNNIAAVARQIGFIGFVFFMLFNTRKLIWK